MTFLQLRASWLPGRRRNREEVVSYERYGRSAPR